MKRVLVLLFAMTLMVGVAVADRRANAADFSDPEAFRNAIEDGTTVEFTIENWNKIPEEKARYLVFPKVAGKTAKDILLELDDVDYNAVNRHDIVYVKGIASIEENVRIRLHVTELKVIGAREKITLDINDTNAATMIKKLVSDDILTGKGCKVISTKQKEDSNGLLYQTILKTVWGEYVVLENRGEKLAFKGETIDFTGTYLYFTFMNNTHWIGNCEITLSK